MTPAVIVERRTDILSDLLQARTDLVEARREQGRKDTPAARVRVASCLTHLDALLDMWNDGPGASR